MKRLILSILVVACLLPSPQANAQTTAPAIQWDKTYGGQGNHASMYTTLHLQQTADGGYIQGGTSRDPIGGDKSQASKGIEDYWIVKTDANGNKQWDKAFGGSSWEILTAIQQTSDGGYILGGMSGSGISGDKTEPLRDLGWYDYWVVKLDANGNKIWDKTLGGNDWDELTSIQQTSDGGYIVGGHSQSGIGGDKTQPMIGTLGIYEDYWIVKLDANGSKQWDKTFGGNDTDELTSLQQTSDGGYILGGYSYSGLSGDKSQASKGNGDYWIIKIDAAGNKLWDKVFGGNMNDILHSLHQTADGGYVLGGYSGSDISGDKTQPSKGGNDYWVVKLDANGNKTWDKTIGGSANDELQSLNLTSDGGYITGGRGFSGISGDKTEALRGFYDYWVVKLDASGNKLWDKTLGGNGADDLTSLQQTAEGGYIIGGQSTSQVNGDKTQANKGYDDFWVIKLGPTCADLTAALSAPCSNGGTTVNVNVTGIQTIGTGTPSWTLTYTVNGVNQTATGTSNTFSLAQNAAASTVYSLVSITSGACTSNLNGSLAVQPVPMPPAAPAVMPGNNCGAGSVSLSASGAPAGGSYVWYGMVNGGTALHTSTTGTFATPVLNSTTTFYVAATNNAGCEGPRTPVTATITNVAVNAGPNEVICFNAVSVLLTGFSPAGGTWSGSGVSPMGIFIPNSGLVGNQALTYTVTQNGCTATAIKYVTVPTAIAQSTISHIPPDTLMSSIAGNSYIWTLNGTPLPVTTRKLKATASGTYAVQVKDANNCASAFSPDYAFTISGIKEMNEASVKLYPNPANGIVTLELAQPENARIEVYNALGQCILKKAGSKQENETILDLTQAAKGIYTVRVIAEKQTFIKKVVLE